MFAEPGIADLSAPTPDGVVLFRDDIYNRDGFGGQTDASRG